jgi:Type II secretion system (T2SS), protein E, N-terminal domain
MRFVGYYCWCRHEHFDWGNRMENVDAGPSGLNISGAWPPEEHTDLDEMLMDPQFVGRLTYADAIRLGCVVVRKVDGAVLVAVMAHQQERAARELPWLLGSPVTLMVVESSAIARAIEAAYAPLDAAPFAMAS